MYDSNVLDKAGSWGSNIIKYSVLSFPGLFSASTRLWIKKQEQKKN